MEKKLLAEALLELAKTSTTEIIEAAANDELIEAGSKLGLVLPSPDLAVLKTVYAEIDKVNKNGVVLPRKSVEEGLPTLVGKQVNWEHLGSGNVCGYIIGANIKEDKIEIIAVVFKSLFPEEWQIVLDKFKKGTLAVSFEIWDKDPVTRKSVVSELANGNLEISPIIFHGCGLLLTSAPACPKAKIYKLLAKEEDKSFTEDLVYARMAIEEPKCNNCENCTCEKEVKIVEEIKAAEKLCLECKTPLPEDMKDEELCAVCKTKKEEKNKAAEVIVEETKVAAEAKPEEVLKTTPEETAIVAEVKPEVVAEVVAEEKKEEVTAEKAEEKPLEVVETPVSVVSIITEEIVVRTEIPEGEGYKTETRSYRRTTTEYSDGKKDVREEEMEIVTRYLQAQLDEAVTAAKAEKDIEIAKLKEELEKKPQEIAKASIEGEAPVSLAVGEVSTTDNDKFKQIQENVNLKAYGHR